jgi:hypothetical protein
MWLAHAQSIQFRLELGAKLVAEADVMPDYSALGVEEERVG